VASGMSKGMTVSAGARGCARCGGAGRRRPAAGRGRPRRAGQDSAPFSRTTTPPLERSGSASAGPATGLPTPLLHRQRMLAQPAAPSPRSSTASSQGGTGSGRAPPAGQAVRGGRQ
jgi:hypothetical protein